MKRLLLILAVPAIIARLLQLLGLHPLVWDEIEFFRATDFVRQGLVPYRDFWEHHTPLQWFLYAPVAALTHSPGVPAVILLRLAQIPIWIATFLLLMRWMERAGIVRWARWAAIVTALCSSLFMLPAVEYRVDALGCFFLVLAIYFVQRIDDGVVYAVWAGVAFCLAGFANLRLGPVIAISVLLIRIVRTGERRWSGNIRANWIYAGAAGMFALGALYFLATKSAAVAFQRVWVENFIADRLNPVLPWIFFTRLAAQFGVRRFGNQLDFDPSGIDPAGIIILVAGLLGVARVLLRNRRNPDDRFYLAFLAIANLVFIWAMKYVYNYHLEIVVLTLIPFVAMEIEAFVPRRVAMAGLAVLLCVSAVVGTFRGKEGDTRYQDHIMRAVDRETPPGSKVWDGAGWPLRRKPAYRYWFLRQIVIEMEETGRFEPYTVNELLGDPPAAVIADHDTRAWMMRHPQLRRAIVAHYLPSDVELWLPGMSARLSSGGHIDWFVPTDGTYTIYASPRLAAHPWFRQPLFFQTNIWHDRATVAVRPSDSAAAGISFSVNGVPVPPGTKRLTLHRHDHLMAASSAPVPMGILLPRISPERLFILPPPGATLEASFSPRWHIPDLSVLLYSEQ